MLQIFNIRTWYLIKKGKFPLSKIYYDLENCLMFVAADR